MKIVIIGAGLTGLTAAYRLSQKGHQVTIFEKESAPGGLAAGFREKKWDWDLEHFYHHLFASDNCAKALIKELGLEKKLFYLKPKTSILYKKDIFQFDSPASVIKFPHLSPGDKLRTGLVTLYLKFINDWQGLEKTTAFKWLKKYYGEKTFEILWQPLLRSKFGSEAEKISASWFWARIKKRSQKLGYLEGGFQALIDHLVKEVKKNGGQIFTGREIKNLNDIYYLSEFDKVIFTASTSAFLKIVPDLPKEYRLNLEKLKMIGTISLVLVLKEKFLKDNTYWLNITDSNFPFVAVVEHTNFVDPKYYNNQHILYIGGYYPQNHKYFRMSKEQIFNEFLPFLQKLNPSFDFRLFTIYYLLFTNLYAQPIVHTNYSKIIPPFKTPIPNVYLANIQQVYPWDRGINYAIELGEKIAHEIA